MEISRVYIKFRQVEVNVMEAKLLHLLGWNLAIMEDDLVAVL